jgi:TolB-like protein
MMNDAMNNTALHRDPPLPEFQLAGGGEVARPVQPESVQRHLVKVLVSAEMRRSKKLCQFLQFTVEEVLRGRGSELKEYAIGVGVFSRGPKFDTGADPIVRVQARRLRAKLGEYYLSEGREEPIRIEYPIGSYSPVFIQRTLPQAPLTMPPVETRRIAPARLIAVLPFAGIGGDDSGEFSEGLTDEVMHALSSSPGIRVVARNSCYQFKGRAEDVRKVGELLGVRALVSGSVRIEGAHLRVLAQLIDTQSGMNLWSYAYERELEGMLEAQQKISQEVARNVKLSGNPHQFGSVGIPAAARLSWARAEAAEVTDLDVTLF